MHAMRWMGRCSWAKALCVATLTFFCTPSEPMAQPFGPPEGPVVLTVRGETAATPGGVDVQLDLEALRSVGVKTMETGTIWTEGTSTFEGVELSSLMQKLGAHGSNLRLIALNEYAVEIPMTEAVEGGPLLAYRMNGIDLSPRDKGPLWMVYPYDTNPDYKNEVSYSRSIWQLTTIEVLP